MAQNNQTPGLLSAFMPGQANALSSQLNAGFGGGKDQWRGMLSDVYSPMHNSVNFQYGGVNHGGNDPKNPGKNPTKKPNGKNDGKKVPGTGGPMITRGDNQQGRNQNKQKNQNRMMGGGAQQPTYRQMTQQQPQQGYDPETTALLNMWQRGR